MNVCFNGYNEGIATFEADSTVTVGGPVEMASNGKVKAAQNKSFCGICVSLRDGYAAVQLNGYVKVGYSGSVTVGYNKLVCADKKVKADLTNGRDVLVVDVDTTNSVAGIIL